MSTYRLKIKFGNNQVEVVTSKPAVLAQELDTYRNIFIKKLNEVQKTAPKQEEKHVFFENAFATQIKPEPEIIPKKPHVEVISFEDFIMSYEFEDLFDEFIACAYYFKKVLRQRSFSLKLLNAKFYPAANKLIDSTVLSEGIERGFIHVVNDEGSVKYALNENGEMYFLKQSSK